MTWKTTLDTNIKASAIVDSFTYVDDAGVLSTVKGVFTDEYQDELGVQTKRPQVYVQTSDLGEGEVIGTLWEYDSIQYLARTVESDGDGWSYVSLEKQ